jgi:uncharacterized protein YndB with AHSA1/START domain
VQPVRASITIDRPREEVFEYLADIANHPEFSDHFLKQWRLLRVDSYGTGAGARFRIDAPLQRFSWADQTFIEVLPHHRIVGVGRGGKFNRIKTYSEWVLSSQGSATRVEFMTETDPPLPTDRLLEALTGMRGWYRRKANKMLRRLQRILEEDAGAPVRGRRATVAGVTASQAPAH